MNLPIFHPTYGIAILIAVCIIVWFFRRPMTARVRSTAPGDFVTLEDGVVHYQWHGNPTGQVVVLVHGLTTPSFVWRDMVPSLVEAGYRVLTFDHFGRGFSDRPWRRYSTAFYIKEIDQLMSELRVQLPVHLLGYSMGGAIVTDYAAQRRDKIRKLILLAPAGFLPGKANASWIVRWPVVGDIFMFLFGGAALRRGAKKAAVLEGVDQTMIDLQCRETRFAGFLPAVLSSLRHTIYADRSHAHEKLKSQTVPLLAVFGNKDDVIPLEGAMRLRTLNRDAEIVEIEGAGHSLATTHTDEVNAAILSFLDQDLSATISKT